MRCEPFGIAASRPCTVKVVHVFHGNCKARQWTGTSAPNQFRDVMWYESAALVCDGHNKVPCVERESFGRLLVVRKVPTSKIDQAINAAFSSGAPACRCTQLDPCDISIIMRFHWLPVLAGPTISRTRLPGLHRPDRRERPSPIAAVLRCPPQKARVT